MFELTVPEIFTLIGAIFLLLLGILVLYKSKRDILNILFFLISIVFTIWMFGTFMMFININNDQKIMFWDRFVYLGVVFMPALQYHFSLRFTKFTRKRKILLWGAYSMSLGFLLASRLDCFLEGVFRYEWGAHSIAQPLHHLFLLYFFFYIFALLYNFLSKYKSLKEKEEKKGLILIVISFAVLNLLGGLGYLPAYYIAMYPIFLWAPPIFSILMLFTIARFQLLNVKLITAQLFSVLITVLAFADIILSKSFSELALKITFFIAIAFLGFLFSRSVASEVRRKEELQKMTNRLSKANDQLRKLDNAKSEFISIASHQLRTPLTAIKGFVSLLLEGSYGKISEEVKDTLNKVYASNERLIDLVESLLNLSRIESGRMEYKFEKVNLTEICKEIYDTFAIRAKEKKLYLEFDEPEFSSDVTTDRSKVRETISNLVDNALKYTIRGGVRVKMTDMGEKIRVGITDTGIGVPKEEVPYLFSKFSRGKDISRLNTGGTGLGLHVGKKMMKALGGDIGVESKGADMGSTFFVEIPKEHLEE